MEKYFGPLKVKDVLNSDKKDLIVILFEDGSSELINKEMFDSVSKDTPVDLTDFVNEKMNFLVPKILSLLLVYNIELDDIKYMFRKLENSINMSLETAESVLWGKPIEKRTMLDVDNILQNKKVTLKEYLEK